jgi:hypothetical protein
MIENNKDIMSPDESDEATDEFESNVQTLSDFISVFVANSEQAKLIDDSRTLLYRGQADASFDLSPSVFRNGLLKNEHKMVQKLITRAANDFADIKNHFERLVIMQHYGLPSRLIDVTTNPLVALYFACIDYPDKNGEIIVFFDFLNNHNEMAVRVISALAEYHGKSEQGMRTFLSEKEFAIAKINTSDLLNIPYLLVEPPMNNERIKRQNGAFAIVGIRQNAHSYEKEAFDLRDRIIVAANEGIERSIIIPKESKKQILKELDVVGINKAFLFPELEHQTAYLKSMYEVK